MAKITQSKTTYDPETKIWSGIKRKLKYDGDYSLGEEILKKLLQYPDQINQICYHNGKEYTNREIANLSIRVAQHFQGLGIKQCEMIGLCASNSDYLAPLVIGALLSGLTMSTLDPSFDKDGIKHIFSITKPSIMFCDGAIYEKVNEALKEIDLKTSIFTMKDHIIGVPEITEFLKDTGTEATFKPEPLKLGSSQTALILCSSGTTGLPKGVCVSHAILLNLIAFEHLNPDVDRFLCFSTLYWASGIFILLLGVLNNCTRIISARGYSPIDFFDIIQKYKVTVVMTPPSQMAMAVACPKIKNFDLSSLTTYLCGGSTVPYSLAKRLQPYMPNAAIVSGYGMSEVCSAIALGEVSPSGTTGQVVENREVKIVDDNESLLGPGEKGEICIRTPFPWAGYFGNPAATADIYDKDGWIHSGDIGYINRNGDLFIIDRKKDIMKYNNFHFSPSEIENVINEIPDVSEVCVCGLPDVVSTHLPTAAVVKKSDATLTEDDVYQYVAQRMADFKHLRGGVYFLQELPKTASGKYIRRELTTICEKLRNSKN